jgi:hypothetical protein
MVVTIQLMYHSHAAEEFSTDDLLKLLFDARIYNHSHQISGLLLHSKGEFLQVLEGEPEYVDELFEKISRDHRHERVTLFQRKEITQREFAQWGLRISATLQSRESTDFPTFLKTTISSWTTACSATTLGA